MKLIRQDKYNWEEKPGYSKKIFLTEKDLSIPGALFQKIRIKPGQIAKEHHHKKQTEIFFFFNENGYWLINGEKITPKKEEILVIQPNDRHEIINNSAKDYLYLAFKYNYSVEDYFDN